MPVGKRLPDRVPGCCCLGPPPPALLTGIEEFNAGLYFEAHETLERLWVAEPDSVRILYQGILQVGVGLHHLRRHNYRGAINLLAYGLDKLHRLPSPCRSVEVARLTGDAARCRAAVIALGPTRLGAFDWRWAPRVHLASASRTNA